MGGAARLRPALEDGFRICLVAVDVQNTFCIPGFELFVGGTSGGAERRQPPPLRVPLPQPRDDHAIIPTLDTHRATQIFHPVWLSTRRGEHPDPYTLSRPRTRGPAAGGSTPPGGREHRHSTPIRPACSYVTTRGSSRRAASTRSRSGRTTRCWAESATRSSPPSRRRSSSTRSPARASRTSR